MNLNKFQKNNHKISGMQIHDPSEDWLDPRIAAVNLLQMLARYRQKDTLPKLLPFMEGSCVQ